RRYAAILLRSRQEADNLVYDCLALVLDQLHIWRDKDDIRMCLFATMRNLFVSPRRRGRKCRQLLSINCLGTNLKQDDCKMSDIMLRSLHSLPEEQRSVLFLVSIESLTYGAVAQVLDIPTGTVMSQLACGRERFRQILDGRTLAAC